MEEKKEGEKWRKRRNGIEIGEREKRKKRDKKLKVKETERKNKGVREKERKGGKGAGSVGQKGAELRTRMAVLIVSIIIDLFPSFRFHVPKRK